MVYNAMKLFMEINPQLFDDCSHDYTELQNSAEAREQARKRKWDKLQEQANRMKSGLGRPTSANAPNSKFESDPVTQDSQKRLDALKLHDEAINGNKPSSVRRHHHVSFGSDLLSFVSLFLLLLSLAKPTLSVVTVT
jgi:serine/threonine-protein phosphatase 2A regulatory subunit B'